MIDFENIEENEVFDIIMDSYKKAAGYEEFEPMDGDAVKDMANEIAVYRKWSKEDKDKFENYANIREGNIDPHKYDINLNEMKNKKAFQMPTLKEILENSPESMQESNLKEDLLDKEMNRLKALAEGNINKDFKNENFQSGVMGGPGANSGSKFGQAQGRTVNSMIDDLYDNPSVGYKHTAPLAPEEALDIAIKRVLKSGAPINNLSFYDEINLELQSLGFPGKNAIDIKAAITALITK